PRSRARPSCWPMKFPPPRSRCVNSPPPLARAVVSSALCCGQPELPRFQRAAGGPSQRVPPAPLAFLLVSLAPARQRLCFLLVLRQPVVAVDGEPFPRLLLAIGPDDRERADLVLLAQAEDVPRVACRQVAAAPLGKPPLCPAADLQADASPD